MIDLDRRIVIDLIEGRQGADLRKWLLQQPAGWLKTVKVVATGDERLTDRGRERLLEGLRLGDPYDEVLGGWLAREMVRDVKQPAAPH
jgi:hypothetical protein